MSTKINQIRLVSEPTDIENDNIDVHLYLDDGRVYSLIVSTPNNIYWCMENESRSYFFGFPPLFVRELSRENISIALEALVSQDNGKWLAIYGALQDPEE
jgi:hypothetical protein